MKTPERWRAHVSFQVYPTSEALTPWSPTPYVGASLVRRVWTPASASLRVNGPRLTLCHLHDMPTLHGKFLTV